MSVETTIDFLSAALRAMRLESGRSGKHDLFADRLRAASDTLAALPLPGPETHLRVWRK